MQLTQLRSGEDGREEEGEEGEVICERNETRLEGRKRGSETARRQRRRKSKTKEHTKKTIRIDTEDRDTHTERHSEVEIERRKRGKKRTIKDRGKEGIKEENKGGLKVLEKGVAGKMMSSGLDSWKRHDSGVKSSDDDLENALTVGEFDGALTGLDLADNEINNNSISHWMSGKHKESLLNSPPLPTLSFNRTHPSPHHPALTSTPCLPSITHHQQQQQQLSYHQFPSPVPSGGGGGGGGGNGPHHQIQQIQPQSSHQRSDSGNFSQSDWTSFITSINLGQIYDTQYQYIVSAATTPCTKLNEETLTYLNQGQSYELKLKKVGDTVQIDNEQILKSVVRVIFHERRLQYMEREQLEIWKQTRPGERILDIDIPLSYGLLDVKIDPHQLSCIEFTWDPRRDSGVYIKVNAISTEFTPRRHGGEKGVPFRIQVETYSLHPDARELARLIHCASCQVKVFKPKGADRKYKTDREKIEKKSDSEREKFQPAFECTVLTEIPLDQVKNYLDQLNCKPDQESMSLTSSMRMDPMLAQSPGGLVQQQPGTPIPGPPLPPLPPLPSQRGIMSFEETMCLQSSGDGFRGVESTTSVTQRFNDASFTSNTTYASPQPLSTSANNMTVDTKQSPPIISASMNQSTSSSGSSSYSPKCMSPPILDHQPMTPPMTYNSPIQQQFNSLPLLPPPPHPQTSLAMCSSPSSILQSNGVFQMNNSIVDKNLTAQCITPSASLLQIIPDVRQVEPYADTLLPDSTAEFVVRWLISQRFSNFVKIFQNFSGSDLLRLSREDLIEICGLADGIRLNNALRAKIIRPRLLIYVFQERNIQCDMTRGCGASRSSPRLIASTLNRTGSFPTQPLPLPSTPHCPSPSCTSSPSSTQSCIDSTSSALSPHPSICASPDEGRKTRSSRPQQLLLPAKIKRSADYDYDYDYNDVDNDNNNCCSDSSNSNAKKISRKSRELCHNEGGCFAVYLEFLTVTHLQDKLSALYRIETNQIYDIYYEGPTGVRVPVTDSVVQNFTDHSKFGLETHQDEDHVGLYHVLMRHSTN